MWHTNPHIDARSTQAMSGYYELSWTAMNFQNADYKLNHSSLSPMLADTDCTVDCDKTINMHYLTVSLLPAQDPLPNFRAQDAVLKIRAELF